MKTNNSQKCIIFKKQNLSCSINQSSPCGATMLVKICGTQKSETDWKTEVNELELINMMDVLK